MTAAILSIIAYLLPFILAGVKAALEEKRRKEARTYANDTATFDQALHERDADRLSLLFNELRPPAAPGDGNPGGQNGDAPAER